MDIECEQCGGTDFYKEAGFYFCSGCQLQSQEVQEYVFDDNFANETRTTKKIQKEKPDRTDNRITSWECYNYILLGLTGELINLGADARLKSVVRLLWLRYLEKMQVFKKGQDVLPKLQAVGSLKDAEIVYGKFAKKKRKRNKSSSSELDLTSLDASSMKMERIKRKRALVKAQYEDFSQKSQATSSLHNETLTSLQTGSEKSSKDATPISYNIYASREMRRMKKSRKHWREHCADFERNLKCHKLNYRTVCLNYRQSPYVLSLNKLYSILYLGLLIVKDKIQLGDMLRFISEGNLSFNCYSHLLPDDFVDKSLNFRNFKKNSLFANMPMRRMTSQMSTFLKVDAYVSTPDLVELCERYCRELNLPDEICDCSKNFLSRVGIKMSFRRRGSKIPNYEGRVLSVILFVLKLLFALDDVTEFHYGSYSDMLNTSDAVNPKMFDIIQWLKHLEYRRTLMTKLHFPTSFSSDDEVQNVSLALSVFGKKEFPTTNKRNSSRDNYKQLLTKLKEELPQPEINEFPISLTPFRDAVKHLPKTKFQEVLFRDFCKDSLVHVLRPLLFINLLSQGKDVEVINGGANEDWAMEKISRPWEKTKSDMNERRQLVTVELTFGSNKSTEFNPPESNVVDGQTYKSNFHQSNKFRFEKNRARLENYCDVDHLNVKRLSKDLKLVCEDYSKHYNPYERFWMRTQLSVEVLNQERCKKFVDEYPHNFALVFKECQRIACQSEQEFLAEYQMTELFLVYMVNYKKKNDPRSAITNKHVKFYLEKCAELW